MAAITTTARRIARALNAYPADVRVAFDADGRELDREYGPSQGRLDGAHILPSRPDSRGGRWTQRTVQDALDEPELTADDWDFADEQSAEMGRA